ncbi:hypothetical protein ACP4OV_022325 [Aristida adscensionis]
MDAGGSGDRLSSLSDGVLGHILSFLPADEAARAAALARRWRDVFAHVHTVSMEEETPEGSIFYCGPGGCDYSSQGEPPPQASRFVTAVGAALLGRHRSPGGAPLRALRVAFVELRESDAGFLDGWLSYLVRQAVATRFVATATPRTTTTTTTTMTATTTYEYDYDDGYDDGDDDGDDYDDDDYDDDYDYDDDHHDQEPYYVDGCEYRGDPSSPASFEYVAPRRLFSSAVLRTLRIGPCRLEPPDAIVLPSLHTLLLTRVAGADPDDAIGRLVAACPRLADLTLEACAALTTLTVAGTRLRSLTLRCCHNLTAVAVDSSELRVFNYRGAVPEPPLLAMRGGPRLLSSCSLDFCGEEASDDDPSELARLRGFLELFAGVEDLHIKSSRLGAGINHDASSSGFPSLRHLELMGILPHDGAAGGIAAVTAILEGTPNLETLTIIFMPEPDSSPDRYYHDHDEALKSHKLEYSRHAELAVPDMAIPCLREINLVHYQGLVAQRMLAKFLLRNAPAVDEVCGEFARGPLWIQTKLMDEIREWTMNKSANMMFF